MLKLKALLMCLFASRDFVRMDNSAQEAHPAAPRAAEGAAEAPPRRIQRRLNQSKPFDLS